MFYLKRAGSSTAEFFTSGQSAPWWLVGTSMVATTFSTDTPNLVTDFVRSHGVSYNWVWWAFLLTGMATVFFYAQLWRRSRVLTDLEFYELRYSGKPAAVVRGFRAVYLGLFFNIMIMSTVTLAAVKIANVMLGWGRVETIVVAGTACVIFASVSGLVGRAGDGSRAVRARDGGRDRRGDRRAAAAGRRRVVVDAQQDRSAHALAAPRLQRHVAHAHRSRHTAHRTMVVGVVSRRRAGGRELHRAADPRIEERAARARRDPLVQRGALRAAAVAVDHRRALFDARFSRRWPTSSARFRT